MDERASLLAELKLTHRDLLEATQGFEAMLRRGTPDAMLLANARRKLVTANGRRHIMLERIYSALRDLEPADVARIRQLRAEGMAAKVRSSEFIAVWTPSQVMQNWAGFVGACAPIGPSVRTSVRDEQRILYPLLEAGARAAA